MIRQRLLHSGIIGFFWKDEIFSITDCNPLRFPIKFRQRFLRLSLAHSIVKQFNGKVRP